jgi:putative Holliday junction resolvase
MSILGIDYGQRKIGLAIAEEKLAEPYKVIRFESEDEAIEKIKAVVKSKTIDRIVIGVSEGKSESEARRFGKLLSASVLSPVTFSDETLTTQDAQRLSIEAGLGREKRKRLEDAFAATVMLQLFVDENV